MRIFTGKVISKKMQKTATIEVERVVAHPVYKKRMRKVRKYHVHDEKEVKVGDVVKFVASKPYSKLKRWEVVEVVEKPGVSKKKSAKKTKKPKAGSK